MMTPTAMQQQEATKKSTKTAATRKTRQTKLTETKHVTRYSWNHQQEQFQVQHLCRKEDRQMATKQRRVTMTTY
eukprot:719928-Amphidinium_carterae.1